MMGLRATHARSPFLLRPSRVFNAFASRPAKSQSASNHSELLRSGGLSKRSLLQKLILGSALVFGAGAMQSSFVSLAAAADSEAAKVLQDAKWPDTLPYGADDFQRFDESSDSAFYSQPRFVMHIDDQAIAALTSYYERSLPKAGSQNAAVLDLCSSWISHYPANYRVGRISGLGMNKEELQRNPVLTDFEVRDLNEDPRLPYDDNSFDTITNTVSVDYLNKPIELFKEMHRVLKPGGRAIMSFSNRCFPTKAVAIWTGTGDMDHIWIVGSYYHYSVPGGWSPPEGIDISPKAGLFGRTDPMYVVTATKV